MYNLQFVDVYFRWLKWQCVDLWLCQHASIHKNYVKKFKTQSSTLRLLTPNLMNSEVFYKNLHLLWAIYLYLDSSEHSVLPIFIQNWWPLRSVEIRWENLGRGGGVRVSWTLMMPGPKPPLDSRMAGIKITNYVNQFLGKSFWSSCVRFTFAGLLTII